MRSLSELYTVHMDGVEVPVYHTHVGDYALACFTGSREFRIAVREPFESVTVRPLAGQHTPLVEGASITLTLTDRDRVSVEPFGLRNPLFLLCAVPLEQPANATHVFRKGTVSHIGRMELFSHDTVYIEDGAVVVGSFFADKQRDITVLGNGVMLGTPLHGEPKSVGRLLRFIECEDVCVSGITMIDGPTWHLVPIACRRVAIDGVNIIGIVMSGDGIDIVGCEDVTITHCFISVNDDCIAIKANRYEDPRGCKDAKRITASDCVLWNQKCGNAVEIGYEASCEEICDVLFEDIDVIHAQYEGWQSGGVFTIHNGDRAHVHDIVYRRIRVEDAEEKLIDVKILTSKYSVDKWRGRISNLVFDDIDVSGEILPPSILRGYESDSGEPNLITGVCIRNLRHNGVPVTGRLQAHLITELSQDIKFE